MDQPTLEKYDVPGPRYTSYPTAPQWTTAVTGDTYAAALQAFGANDRTLSLYVHVPFCEKLCYFCACSKVIRARDEKVGDEFLQHLYQEMDLVAWHIGRRKLIRQLHWGGGTPTYLSERQMIGLMEKIRSAFDLDPDAEIALEVDPRTVTQNKLAVLRQLGFNRISMGVQDFDAKVQDDINRVQPYAQVAIVHAWCRDLGFASVNYDLIYGLPYQTSATFSTTVDLVLGLQPDRIALYSFAYVPWLSKPQNKFNLDAIARHGEKMAIFLEARENLLAHGYQAIAMDHFALRTDAMAKAFNDGTLHRNFMGYTLKPADEYLGLGPSAIGFLENTHVQNTKNLSAYYATLTAGRLPVERGIVLNADDQIRLWVINALMCQFQVDKQAFREKFGRPFDDYFAAEAGHLHDCIEDGLLTEDFQALHVTDLGKIFVRNICMGFDAYLRHATTPHRFSSTV